MEAVLVLIAVILGFELASIKKALESISIPEPDFSSVEEKLENIFIALGGDKIINKRRKNNFNKFKKELIKRLVREGMSRTKAIKKTDELLGSDDEDEDLWDKDSWRLSWDNLLGIDVREEDFYKADKIRNAILWLKRQEIKKSRERFREAVKAGKIDKTVLDELFNEALRIIRDYDRCTASLLQRRLKVGYVRAALIIDQLHELGFVGPSEGSKPRKVFTENIEKFLAKEEGRK